MTIFALTRYMGEGEERKVEKEEEEEVEEGVGGRGGKGEEVREVEKFRGKEVGWRRIRLGGGGNVGRKG